ncbi:restriction endonuclease subunit S [Vibrio sp. 2026]|uniref:restriction endonuclease subunit S n=1 Tax=Vibrio TaxID=662 RepID=UPI0015F4B9D9|nr:MULTISPECIES: restriction endonuclease subunit S [Vibrio]MDG2625967.1 restriction endonuclease subunit S [Vibrio parahaemolyticus]MBT0068167.1 restriction endonuclease subunit S [Vibrio alginolyticus]MDW1515839.1 restriction endonuclease subunit S [Vibrio sp. Vb5035]MDW1545775.1 restriction endonuclease subunit S [Vibrio sp. Vb5034]MDW1777638.1 restriction endonuclease subunit S [Vibrio sp. Vb2175]
MTGRYKAYPEYKASGSFWFDKIPSDWQVILLKRVVSAIKDGTHGTYPRVSEGVPFLSAKNVFGSGIYISESESQISLEHHNEIVQNGFPTKGDLLITCVGTVGRAFVYDRTKPLAFQRSVAFVRFNKSAFPQYYKYYVESKPYQSQLKSLVKASAQGGVYMGDLVATESLLPPYIEQQKIANFLDHETAKIDTLITKQERLIELLKEKRQAVISHAVTKGLNPDAPMKDSGVEWLGEVPEHWVVAQLKINTVLMQTGPFGSQLHAEDYVEGGIPLINPAHMIDGKIIPDMKVTVDIETQERLCRHKLSKGDIIFARRGELGRCAIVQSNQVGWLCGTGSLKATLNERLIPEYAYLLITSEGVTAELSLESKGSTMDNLNTETLGKIRTPVPPTQEQLAILDYVNDVSGKYKRLIENAVLAIKLMKERKTALISAAVTGKIDVRDWQKPTEQQG